MIRSHSTPNRKKLIRTLLKKAVTMIQAGLSQTRRTCGTPSCGCHEDPSRRHGPHAYLTFRSRQGKSSSLYVSPEHLPEAEKGRKAWEEFWEAATALAALNRQEMKERWRAGGKAR